MIRALPFLMLILWSAGCARHDAAPVEESETAVVAVQVRRVDFRPFAPRVEAVGRWRAAGELTVVAPFAATIDSLPPRIGQRVAQGETIGWLVTRESQSAIRGAELLSRQADDAASREEANRALALARHDRVRVPLVAPAAGTITQRRAERGAEVAEGAELLTIVLDGALVFEAHVALGDAAKVSGRRRSHIVMDDGRSIEAMVGTRVPSTNAADQSALVWISPTRPAGPELLEQFGRAFIEIGTPRDALAVPDSALVEDDLTGERRVVVVDSTGMATWHPLELGIGDRGWHEVIGGEITSGALVVIRGQRGLPDSTRVRFE